MGEDMVVWKNGRLVRAEEAVVPILDHGLLYGDGAFEWVRFFNRRPFRLERHLTRLSRSAAGIDLSLPFDAGELAAGVRETIAAAPAADGYLRILVTRGEGALGVNPEGCGRPAVFIIAAQLAVVPAERRQHGLTAVIASTRRPAPDSLDPRIKSLNYLTSVLARAEANRAGVDEAIMLNRHGCVVEASVENIFLVLDGALRTPPVTDGALDGITRGAVLELAAARGLRAEERSLTPVDLYAADEAFLTGTGAGLLPLSQVDGRRIRQCPGPVFESLDAAYQALVRR